MTITGYKDIQFPSGISYGSSGGPQYSTSVIRSKSGKEKRNSLWTYPAGMYDVGYGIRGIDDLEALIEFFHIVEGMGYTFRYKDWADYKSCRTGETVANTDQELVLADDNDPDIWQLQKTYEYTGTDGSTLHTKTRKIILPVRDSVVCAIDGSPISSSNFDVDYETGEITFDTAVVVDSGSTVTAGFEFDVHARFDTDEISIVLDDYKAASTQVPIVEVKV